MQVDRQTLFFFMLMFIFLTFQSGNDQPHSDNDRVTLLLFHNQLKESRNQLVNSLYYGGYGNITGFHLSYQDLLSGKNVSNHHFDQSHPWQEIQEYSILPNAISQEVTRFWSTDEVLDPLSKTYLFNISGAAHGHFTKISTFDLRPYNWSMPPYLQRYYESQVRDNYEDDNQRYKDDPETYPQPERPTTIVDKIGNITFDLGKISISISADDYNYKNGDVAKLIQNSSEEIHDAVVANVRINLKDDEEAHDHEIDTQGIYFQSLGSLVSVTKSAKFLGIYGLDHLVLDEDRFNKSKILMTQLLNLTKIDTDITMEDMFGYMSSSIERCELISYFQFKKTNHTTKELRDIDEELLNPSGKPLPHDLLGLEIENFLIYSPDCGIAISQKSNTEFTGWKTEVLNRKLKNVLTGLLVLVFLQLILYLRQIRITRTPGQLASISLKSLYLLGYQDSLLALMFLLISTLIEDLYLLLASIAVVSFIMCGIFELRFMVAVATTQVNERGASWWEILRGSTRDNNNDNENNTDTTETPTGTPLPTNNQTPNTALGATVQTPVVTYSEETAFSNSIFAIGFTLTLISTFMILNALIWRTKYRKIFEYVGFIFTNSYWVPQFFRNTLKNRRKSFSWEFVLGSSLIRLIPVAYFCLVSSNPLRHHFDPILVLTIFSWLFIQIFAMFLQSKLGPRFWVNEKWLPKAYDYQPVLSMKELETGFASDILSGIKPTEEHDGIINTKCTCPICMNDLQLPILNKNEARSRVTNKEYMITPCKHIFHDTCLESWMNYKLQCPVCRQSLPPM